MSALSSAWAITPAGLESLDVMARSGIVESLQAYAAAHDPNAIAARSAHMRASMLVDYEDDDCWWFDPYCDAHVRPSGIGILPIRGPLFDRGWACYQGYDQIIAACQEFEAQYHARLELRDTPDLIAVVIPIESPGGLCVGLLDCCDAVRRLRELVPVYTVADREACSAAEAIAAQGTLSYCTRDSLRGSLGARMTHIDYSGHLAKEGENVQHFVSGRYKTAGAGDVPRSPETVELFTDFTGKWAELFRGMMFDGRGMTPQAFDATEARIYHGADAVDVGLCDAVLTLNELLEGLETDGSVPDEVANESEI